MCSECDHPIGRRVVVDREAMRLCASCLSLALDRGADVEDYDIARERWADEQAERQLDRMREGCEF